ncbi:hypothetical protein PHYPSEUDO_005091 [Phytophthora pseudosyringae]|uniref:Uncharacterized protein n=1 Tax=Phytophthora pseudosyringae TaxID=221518 RepID=A0A8T1VPZ5_9STRA|nr:hypothetical protein PHYPSEUDO_005091 [Phytophthora pseudosyringae]
MSLCVVQSEAAPLKQSRKLQGLIGSLVDTVLGGDTTEATTPSPTTTSAPTTKAPSTRTPTPTTRTPAPTTRTPAPTTKTRTPQPTTATPTPTPTPTAASTPEPTPEPSLETAAPETPLPTIGTNTTSFGSFAASVDSDSATNSSSGSVAGSLGDWSSADSQTGGGLAASQDAEVYADTPVNTWMVVAIALAAVSMVLLCFGAALLSAAIRSTRWQQTPSTLVSILPRQVRTRAAANVENLEKAIPRPSLRLPKAACGKTT